MAESTFKIINSTPHHCGVPAKCSDVKFGDLSYNDKSQIYNCMIAPTSGSGRLIVCVKCGAKEFEPVTPA